MAINLDWGTCRPLSHYLCPTTYLHVVLYHLIANIWKEHGNISILNLQLKERRREGGREEKQQKKKNLNYLKHREAKNKKIHKF